MIERFSKVEFEAALPRHNTTGSPLWVCEGMDKGEYLYTLLVLGTNKRIVIRSSIRSNGFAADTGNDSIRHWVEYNYKSQWYPLSKDTKAWTTRVAGWEIRLDASIRRLWKLALVDSRKGIGGKPVKEKSSFMLASQQPPESQPHRSIIDLKPDPEPAPKQPANAFSFLDNATDESSIEGDTASLTPTERIGGNVADFIAGLPLNDYQKDVVSALARGPQVIEAAPGSGKTRTLENLVAALIISGVDPSKIGVFTFSNLAASEARRRIANTLWPEASEKEIEFLVDEGTHRGEFSEDWIQSDPARGMLINWTCTIHALAYRLLREHGEKLSVIEDYEAKKLVRDSLDEMKWEESHRSVLSYIGTAIRNLIEPGDSAMFFSKLLAHTDLTYRAGSLAQIYKRYLTYCEHRHLIDFDMMQAKVVKLLRYNLTARRNMQEKFDYILVDEAQDTSPEQAEILWALAERTGNVVFCGDLDQCLIAGTMVDGKLIEKVEVGDFVPCGYGDKVVFGKVTNKFVKDISAYVKTIKTVGGRSITSTLNHRHFAGYVIEEEKELYFTYLMYKEGLGYRVGVTSFIRRDGNRRSVGFEHRLRAERADSVWVLKAVPTKAEAQYWEQFFSVGFGLPTWTFHVDGRRTNYGDEEIARLFSALPTHESAANLLNFLDMDINTPHHIPRSLNKSRRRTFTITMCASQRGGGHTFSISGSEKVDGDNLAVIGLPVRPAKAGRGWRIESSRTELSNIYAILDRVNSIMPVTVKEQMTCAGTRLPLIPAANVKSGMKVFVMLDGKIVLDEVLSEENTLYTGKVYDLCVEKYHHYAANGILTHNSMYMFRGAEPDVLRAHFQKQWPAVRRFNLPINYRSTQEIINRASILIENNYTGPDDPYLKPFQYRPDAPEGAEIDYSVHSDFMYLTEEVASIVTDSPGDWFVLSRTCAECSSIHTELIRNKIPAINKKGGLLFSSVPVRKVLAYARLACNYQEARNNEEILSEIANVATVNFKAPYTRRNHRDGCTESRGWIDCGCPLIVKGKDIFKEDADYSHARYYGKKHIQKAGGWKGILQQQYEVNRGGFPTPTSIGAEDLVQFVTSLEDLIDEAGACLRRIISDCVLPWIAAEYGLQEADLADDGAVELLDLLLTFAKSGQSMTEYLNEVEAISAGEGAEGEEDSVIISTIHWSKGRERPGVILNATRLPIIPPMNIPGKLPMGRPSTIEEERRLAYVAVTRAKDVVHVVSSTRWLDKDVPVSRFIQELGITISQER